MNELLQEFVAAGVGRLDRSSAVLRGVKILGRLSRNNREYTGAALSSAIGLYEGAKVNVNHAPRGNPSGPRSYQDRIGVIRNVTTRADGLFADFHFNPKHALAEQLLWDAEHAPGNVGFSHNVQARTTRQRGRVVVEEITRVESVDLVADPATTHGLFEAVDSRQAMIENVAGELGLPIIAVDGLRGLEHRHTEAEVREYLVGLKAGLVESGHLPAGRPKLAPADRGIAPRGCQQFAEIIGGRIARPDQSDTKRFTEAIGGPIIPNGFVESITT